MVGLPATTGELVETNPVNLAIDNCCRGVLAASQVRSRSKGRLDPPFSARAILRDAQILILDEPTSSVDAETEALSMEGFERLMAGRTTFIIAHRLSTVQRVDVI